ncbi:MAG: hypothetical protein KTR32_01340 [Granulosicoccus sp.]|nr:hypothetical protein [Granulosicoccus sp.]
MRSLPHRSMHFLCTCLHPHIRCHTAALIFLCAAIVGCSPGQPDLGGAKSGGGNASGQAAPLSDSAFAAMSVDQQYQVTNKILGTLYKGVSVADFYDLSNGLSSASNTQSLNQLRQQLLTPLPDAQRSALDLMIVGDPDAEDDETGTLVRAAFKFDDNRPRQMPLARMYSYPLSRDLFSQWMAWHLANSILFSPAEEIDSADMTDVQNLFRRLVLSIMDGRSIRDMVATHQRSVENWRRFRSPEDNTREMMEIYLGLFENDAEVPKASQACRDLYLTDERDGYKLAYTDFPNDEPQLVLGTYVLNCGDFYDVVASHPLLIPRVTSILVDYFFADRNADERLALTESIAASNPVRFEDIFLAILFSQAYLLDTERPASFEETYLGMASRLRWEAHRDVFRGMTGGRGGLSRTYMAEMGWPTMSLKLGRIAEVPADALSFANYHKALRETLMLDRYHWRTQLGLNKPEAPEPAPPEPLPADASPREAAAFAAATEEFEQAVAALSKKEQRLHDEALEEYTRQYQLYTSVGRFTLPELFDYLFLSAVQRRTNNIERTELTTIVNAAGFLDVEFGKAFVKSGYTDDLALLVFDYISRLPETYYLRRLR